MNLPDTEVFAEFEGWLVDVIYDHVPRVARPFLCALLGHPWRYCIRRYAGFNGITRNYRCRCGREQAKVIEQ